MPEMDGPAFLKVLESSPVFDRIPVLVLSGFLEEESPRASLGLNVVGRLAKPVRRADLLAAVQAATSLLKAHRTHGHLAAHLDPLGSAPEGDPALDPEPLGLTPELMARIPAHVLRMYVPGATLADAAGPVSLNHPHCAKFCVLGGGACSRG